MAMIFSKRFLFLAIFFFIAGCSVSKSEASLADLLKKSSISISDLECLNLNIKHGHGLYFWAQLDEKQDVWFWYEPGFLSAAGFGEVILIAYIDKGDVDVGHIVWPTHMVGQDYGRQLELLYPRK